MVAYGEIFFNWVQLIEDDIFSLNWAPKPQTIICLSRNDAIDHKNNEKINNTTSCNII